MSVDLTAVNDCLENEDFDYVFRQHQDFVEINDEEFHKLRLAYIEAANALEAYVQAHSTEDSSFQQQSVSNVLQFKNGQTVRIKLQLGLGPIYMISGYDHDEGLYEIDGEFFEPFSNLVAAD